MEDPDPLYHIYAAACRCGDRAGVEIGPALMAEAVGRGRDGGLRGHLKEGE